MKLGYTIPRHLLDGVDAFLLVAEKRNFRLASVELGISPSALSQKIRALEERVGVPLLVRTTRNVGLTQAGQIFLEHARPAYSGMLAAFEETRSLGEPAGLLRLHMPHAVIPLLIEPVLAGFRAAYPRIDLEVMASDHSVDLVEEGFDAGVQLGELLDSDMIIFRLTPPIRFAVVGAPAYFERHGRPGEPADLRDHACLRLRMNSELRGHWVFLHAGRRQEVAVAGPLITNDQSLLVSAALQGLGLCYLSEGSVRPHLASGALASVLTDQMPTSDGLFLYYPNRAHILPKLRVFLDYVRTHLGQLS